MFLGNRRVSHIAPCIMDIHYVQRIHRDYFWMSGNGWFFHDIKWRWSVFYAIEYFQRLTMEVTANNGFCLSVDKIFNLPLKLNIFLNSKKSISNQNMWFLRTSVRFWWFQFQYFSQVMLEVNNWNKLIRPGYLSSIRLALLSHCHWLLYLRIRRVMFFSSFFSNDMKWITFKCPIQKSQPTEFHITKIEFLVFWSKSVCVCCQVRRKISKIKKLKFQRINLEVHAGSTCSIFILLKLESCEKAPWSKGCFHFSRKS